MLLGVHGGALDCEAVPQKATALIDREAHEHRHAVRDIARACERGVEVADGAEGLEHDGRDACGEQCERLVVVRRAGGAVLRGILAEPLDAAGADGPDDGEAPRRARVIDGGTVHLGHSACDPVPLERRRGRLERVREHDLRARRRIEAVQALHGLGLGEIPEGSGNAVCIGLAHKHRAHGTLHKERLALQALHELARTRMVEVVRLRHLGSISLERDALAL